MLECPNIFFTTFFIGDSKFSLRVDSAIPHSLAQPLASPLPLWLKASSAGGGVLADEGVRCDPLRQHSGQSPPICVRCGLSEVRVSVCECGHPGPRRGNVPLRVALRQPAADHAGGQRAEGVWPDLISGGKNTHHIKGIIQVHEFQSRCCFMCH